MNFPQEALDLIKRSEGLHKLRGGVVHVYPDVAHGWNVATQGYGTTINPETRIKLGRNSPEITPEKAAEWLLLDLSRNYLPSVDRCVSRPLHPLSRGAVGSFVYNVGTGAFKRSTLRKRINADDVPGIMRQWRKWRMAGGRVYPGLVRRREAELALFLKGRSGEQQMVTPTPPSMVRKEKSWLYKIFEWLFR